MDSSDEDDVYMGPISLKEIEKALKIMDPFRNREVVIDENSTKVSSEEDNNDSVILIDESVDSFVYQEPEKPESENVSEPTKHDLYDTYNWNNLVNNISIKPNILDQTEPTQLHEKFLEDTIVPQENKKEVWEMTGLPEVTCTDLSLMQFEAIERLTNSPSSCEHVESDKACNSDYSDFSIVTSVYKSADQSSISDSNDCYSSKDIYITAQNSADTSNNTNSEFEQSSLSSPLIQIPSRDVTYIEQENQSLEFDNTFEEMQYLLNLNNKPEPSTPVKDKSANATLTPEKSTQLHPYPKFSPITPTNDVSSTITTPKSLLSVGRPKKVYYPIPKNLLSTPDFVVPSIPIAKSAKKLQSPRNNFNHIVSPIAMYIKNTPKTPLVENCTPKNKNISRILPKSEGKNKCDDFKENIGKNSPVLPLKAYKTSSYTALNVIKSPNPASSMKKLIGSTERCIISHTNRIKGTKLPRLIHPQKSQDSFADLSVSSAEISVCVQKTPVRTETVLKKN